MLKVKISYLVISTNKDLKISRNRDCYVVSINAEGFDRLTHRLFTNEGNK